MHEDPQEFDTLRKLLALKRHEVPPPGYFDRFSDQVLQRIEADQSASLSLWRQVLVLFRTRPAISWSFSVAAVMLLFVAANGLETHQSAVQSNSMPAFGDFANPSVSTGVALATNRGTRAFGPARIALQPVGLVATNQEPEFDSLFATPFYHQVQPVGYQP